MMVWVVQSSFGEYADRSSWVSGVFESKELAESHVAARLAVRKAYMEWHERFGRAWQGARPLGHFHFPLPSVQAEEYERVRADCERAAGPKPEYEPAEECEIYPMKLNVWSTETSPPRTTDS